jgi:hypothetical protein
MEQRPPPLPYFWYVHPGIANREELRSSLREAGFDCRSIAGRVWYHYSKHAMFCWQLSNSELCNDRRVDIAEYHYNVRKQRPRKSKKVVDTNKQSRYVNDCKQ